MQACCILFAHSPPSDHLSNGKDTIRLESIEGDSLPVAGLEDGSPPRGIAGFSVELLVCLSDVLGVRWGSKLLCNVDLLSYFPDDCEVVDDGFAVGCETAHAQLLHYNLITG